MTSIPTRPRSSNSHPTAHVHSAPNLIGQKICLVAGLTCLTGFLVDMLVVGTPPEPFVIQWRIGFLQQMGDRSIILFFAMSLLLYSVYSQRRLKRLLAIASLVIGVAFLLSCVLVIRDSLIVQEQTVRNISSQERQIQTRIDQEKKSEAFSNQVTPEQLQQFSQQLTAQSQSLKDNARKGIVRTGMASVGNLMIVGLGFVGLGRLGLVRNR